MHLIQNLIRVEHQILRHSMQRELCCGMMRYEETYENPCHVALDKELQLDTILTPTIIPDEVSCDLLKKSKIRQHK